jgi:anti-anti-sigma factor
MRVRRELSRRTRALPDVRRLGLEPRTAVPIRRGRRRTAGAQAPELMADLPQPFFAKRRSNNGRVVIELGGEWDMATLEQLNEVLREAVAARPSEVVIDLALATFVDSLTLVALTEAAKQVRRNGGSFQIVRVSASEIKRALEITGLDAYLLAS